MNTQPKELTIVEQAERKLGVVLANEDEMTMAVDRLMAFHPAANKVGIAGMRQLAELAFAIGANWLHTSGEIYIDRQWDGTLFLAIGIAYYRRIAKKHGTVIWVVEPRVATTTDEKAQTAVPAGGIGAYCVGYTDERFDELTKRGFSAETAERRAARTGYGVVDRNEMFYARDVYYTSGEKKGTIRNKKGDPIPPPRGRTWSWVAQKRAEVDWYKKYGMIDTSFTDRMEMWKELNKERQLRQLSDEQAANYNHELFGGSDNERRSFPVVIDETEIVVDEIEGVYVDSTNDNEPNFFEGDYEDGDDGDVSLDIDEIDENDVETAVDETNDETHVDDVKNAENANLKPNQYTEAESIIAKSSPKKFSTLCVQLIPHYSTIEHVKETAKKVLGYSKIPVDGHDRVVVFRVMKQYGDLRDEGHDRDEALAIIDASNNLPF